MNKRARIDAVFERLAAAMPNPRGELEYINPYTLLVAVVLSAQATDKGVNKATEPLFKRVKTPEQMLKLGEAGLIEYIRTIGLYRGKAKNIIGLSRILIDKYGSEAPRDREALQELPGVGRKTANVVLNIAFGEHTIAVDTHVFRVAHRLGISKGKAPEDVERDLERLTPARFKQNAHHWLILHGRYVCVARKPKCYACPVAELCPYKPKTRAPENEAD